MNNKQKIALVCYVTGLVMIASWIIYDNKPIVIVGVTISLICSFLYGMFECFPYKKAVDDGTNNRMI